MERLPQYHTRQGGENVITTPPTCHSAKKASWNGLQKQSLRCTVCPFVVWYEKIFFKKRLTLFFAYGKMLDVSRGRQSAQPLAPTTILRFIRQAERTETA